MNLKIVPIAQDAAQVQIDNVDYSLADIIHDELLSLKHVKFAGVAPPHPLIKTLMIQLQTDNGESPADALNSAVESAKEHVSELLSLARTTFPEVPRVLEEGRKLQATAEAPAAATVPSSPPPEAAEGSGK